MSRPVRSPDLQAQQRTICYMENRRIGEITEVAGQTAISRFFPKRRVRAIALSPVTFHPPSFSSPPALLTFTGAGTKFE
jgi:hypothetical protein